MDEGIPPGPSPIMLGFRGHAYPGSPRVAPCRKLWQTTRTPRQRSGRTRASPSARRSGTQRKVPAKRPNYATHRDELRGKHQRYWAEKR